MFNFTEVVHSSFAAKEKVSTSSLGSSDSLRKSGTSSNSSQSKSNGSVSDSTDLNHGKDQCNSETDMNSSYLNLENIFETGGENNEEGSLEVSSRIEGTAQN